MRPIALTVLFVVGTASIASAQTLKKSTASTSPTPVTQSVQQSASTNQIQAATATAKPLTIQQIDMRITAYEKKVVAIQNNPTEDAKATQSGWYTDMDEKIAKLKADKLALIDAKNSK